jgi:hypothetical protein
MVCWSLFQFDVNNFASSHVTAYMKTFVTITVLLFSSLLTSSAQAPDGPNAYRFKVFYIDSIGKIITAEANTASNNFNSSLPLHVEDDKVLIFKISQVDPTLSTADILLIDPKLPLSTIDSGKLTPMPLVDVRCSFKDEGEVVVAKTSHFTLKLQIDLSPDLKTKSQVEAGSKTIVAKPNRELSAAELKSLEAKLSFKTGQIHISGFNPTKRVVEDFYIQIKTPKSGSQEPIDRIYSFRRYAVPNQDFSATITTSIILPGGVQPELTLVQATFQN